LPAPPQGETDATWLVPYATPTTESAMRATAATRAIVLPYRLTCVLLLCGRAASSSRPPASTVDTQAARSERHHTRYLPRRRVRAASGAGSDARAGATTRPRTAPRTPMQRGRPPFHVKRRPPLGDLCSRPLLFGGRWCAGRGLSSSSRPSCRRPSPSCRSGSPCLGRRRRSRRRHTLRRNRQIPASSRPARRRPGP